MHSEKIVDSSGDSRNMSKDPEMQLEAEKGGEKTTLYTSFMPKMNMMTASSSEFWDSIFRADVPATNNSTPEQYGGGFFGTHLSNIDNFFRVTDRGGSFLKEFIGKLDTTHFEHISK